MDELLALQRQLVAVQLQSSAKKLSERNCVQIVTKLIETGQLDVLYTLNGKEYVTPKQLKNEIKDEIMVHGGRVTTLEIQSATNVDITHIERSLAVLVADDSSLFVLPGGDVIADYYLDTALEEVNESLKTKGQITIGEISESLQLPTDFVQTAVHARIPSILQAELRGWTLYTAAFMDRETARIRAALSGVTRPTSLSSLYSLHNFNTKMADPIVTKLLADKAIYGVISGREYVPHVFSVAQRAQAVSFFTQNEYLPLDRAAKLQITDARAFLRRSIPDVEILELSSCVVMPSLLLRVSASVDAACGSSQWVDASEDVPFLAAADVSALLAKCDCVKEDWEFAPPSSKPRERLALRVSDNYAVPFQYLNELVQRFGDEAAEAAESLLAASHGGAVGDGDDEEGFIVVTGTPVPSSSAPDSTSKSKGKKGKGKKAAPVEDDEPEPAAPSGKRGGKKGKKGKKGRRGAVDSDSDDDVDDGMPAASGRGRRSGKAGKSKKGGGGGGGDGAGAGAGAGAGGSGKKKGKDSPDAPLSSSAIAAAISKKDSQRVADHPEFLEALADLIAPAVNALRKERHRLIMARLTHNSTAHRRQWLSALSARLADLYPTVSAFCNGLDVLEKAFTADSQTERDVCAAARPHIPSEIPSSKLPSIVAALLHSHLASVILKPFTLRLLLNQCLANNIVLPSGATPVSTPTPATPSSSSSSSSIDPFAEGSTKTVPLSPDEPPNCVGLTSTQLSALLLKLKKADPRVHAPLSALITEVSKRTVRASAVLSGIDAVADVASLRLDALDRKAEKRLLFARLQETSATLASAASNRYVYQLCLVSMFQQTYNAPLLLPEEGWPYDGCILAVVARHLTADTMTLLRQFSLALEEFYEETGERKEGEEEGEGDMDGAESPAVLSLERQSSADVLSENTEAVRSVGLGRLKASDEDLRPTHRALSTK